jgi:hypothetical protein
MESVIKRDLFEHREELPEEVLEVLDYYDSQMENDQMTSIQIALMEEGLRPYGYTFDWGMDMVPFNLRLI